MGLYFSAFDKVFLIVFLLEIIFKWYTDFWGFWRVPWNLFDFFIVFISILADGRSVVHPVLSLQCDGHFWFSLQVDVLLRLLA